MTALHEYQRTLTMLLLTTDWQKWNREESERDTDLDSWSTITCSITACSFLSSVSPSYSQTHKYIIQSHYMLTYYFWSLIFFPYKSRFPHPAEDKAFWRMLNRWSSLTIVLISMVKNLSLQSLIIRKSLAKKSKEALDRIAAMYWTHRIHHLAVGPHSVGLVVVGLCCVFRGEGGWIQVWFVTVQWTSLCQVSVAQ